MTDFSEQQWQRDIRTFERLRGMLSHGSSETFKKFARERCAEIKERYLSLKNEQIEAQP